MIIIQNFADQVHEASTSGDTTTWELIGHNTTGTSPGLVEVTVIPPGQSTKLESVDNSERLTLLVSGQGSHLSEEGAVDQPRRSVVFVPTGQAAGFMSTGDEPAVLLTAYGAITSRADAALGAVTARVPAAATISPQPRSAPDPIPTFDSLNPEPLHAVGNYHLVNADLCDATQLYAGLARFEPAGFHSQHHHVNTWEMLLFLDGGGVIRSGDEEFPIAAGQVAAIPPRDWHGVYTAETADTILFYCYLGAATREAAGVVLPSTAP